MRSLRVAEIVGEGLQRVGGEVVLVPQDMVVRGTARALRRECRSFELSSSDKRIK